MGDVVAFQDPRNYRVVMRQIQTMLSRGSYFIHPHASAEAAADGFDDQDVIHTLDTGRIRPSSHS